MAYSIFSSFFFHLDLQFRYLGQVYHEWQNFFVSVEPKSVTSKNFWGLPSSLQPFDYYGLRCKEAHHKNVNTSCPVHDSALGLLYKEAGRIVLITTQLRIVDPKRSKMILNLVKILTIIVCLYFFICSLDILSTAFKLIGGKATGKIVNLG